ncbi:MAG: class I SAM-dependent rRNA methyltransferase [Chloroflexota bacterium]
MSAYRLFHGDAEGAPGLAIDRFGGVAVIHVNSADVLNRWGDVLQESLAGMATAYLKIHPERGGQALVPPLASFAPGVPAWGRGVAELEVVEYGAHYVVRPHTGLSVGLFLDMREVRDWVRHTAAGRSVLNLFAYTCAFGVSATLGKAARVVNLDVSRGYLDWGLLNYRINALASDSRDFIYGDAFDWLGRFRRRSTRFDMVLVDPPSFSSTPFSVSRDYPKLVGMAARIVEHAGILVAATNHARTSDERFDEWLREGLEMAGRRGEVVQRWREPEPDFPVGPGRRPYLKVRALVLD